MTDRRTFLGTAAAAGLLGPASLIRARDEAGVVVNDIHSELNATRVARVETPRSIDSLRALVGKARKEGLPLCISGGRHAMGGQQFAAGAILVDTRSMDRILGFDRERGLIELEAGIQWPALTRYLLSSQGNSPGIWSYRQKQTGADKLSLGGSLSANAHGRGLTFPPMVSDVESITLIDAEGDLRRCSRSENAELFRLVIGGYGLFGIIASVTLRLVKRQKVQRAVEIIGVAEAMPKFETRIADGFTFGDFQYSINEKDDTYLNRGVFSCYRPVADDTPTPASQKELSDQNWRDLLLLAHADEAGAFQTYSNYYLSTAGQVYWSDTHQLSIYPEGYHAQLDQKLGARAKGTEMITEIYVERPHLAAFMREAAEDFRRNKVEVVYGTVRLIERDTETFLAWAKKAYACIIFNLHVDHTPTGIEHAAGAFRRLIDLGVKYGGSYFPTYHRWATRNQIDACYPQFAQFLSLKRKYDPKERFQSEWYRHYRKMYER